MRRRRVRNHVVTAILGGGQGTRLYPLTRERAKPAVPVGGKFRLIDIAISNSLHAGFDRIYVLTQFNSAGLHRHISQSYRFDVFSQGFVAILAAEQSMNNRDWYQGTADAVRQNLKRLRHSDPSEILVLSGDQLYLMDLGDFLRRHRQYNADVTIAVQPVSREQARSFGIMRVNDEGRIIEFVEKPEDPEELDRLTPSPAVFEKLGLKAEKDSLLASMGMYVFDPDTLSETLEGSSATDFGGEVIPGIMESCRVFAYPYSGYWEDIGTIPAFHRANIDLTGDLPPLNLYDPNRKIYTHARFLPGTKINYCEVHRSIFCEGSILSGAKVNDSIVGIRAVIRDGVTLDRCVVMGAHYFHEEDFEVDGVGVGIGKNCVLRNAILDLDVHIGDDCKLINVDGIQDIDTPNYSIRGGVIVVPRGAVIPPGTII